ncbi:MAG: putative Ig domain-containing protein [Blastocatellia bacterium]
MVTITLRSLRLAALALLLPLTAFAQQGGTYQLQPTVIAGGGGTSNSGTQRIEGTIAQFLAGRTSGGSFQLDTGFWFFPGAAGPVCQPLTVSPTNPVLPDATVGTSYSQSFAASGSSRVNFSAGALPAGLQLSIDGVLSGTPTATGSFLITVTATDASGCTGMQTYSLRVVCATITATASGNANICPGGSAIVSVNFSGGSAPYTVTLTNNDGTKTSSTLPITFTVSPTVTTTYVVASATDAYGCPVYVSGSATIIVGTIALPDTNIISIPPPVSDANVSFGFTGRRLRYPNL